MLIVKKRTRARGANSHDPQGWSRGARHTNLTGKADGVRVGSVANTPSAISQWNLARYCRSSGRDSGRGVCVSTLASYFRASRQAVDGQDAAQSQLQQCALKRQQLENQ